AGEWLRRGLLRRFRLRRIRRLSGLRRIWGLPELQRSELRAPAGPHRHQHRQHQPGGGAAGQLQRPQCGVELPEGGGLLPPGLAGRGAAVLPDRLPDGPHQRRVPAGAGVYGGHGRHGIPPRRREFRHLLRRKS
ncbi:mobilization protein, partial [Dysosmobacter welbionis]